MSSDEITPDERFSKILKQFQGAAADGDFKGAEASIHEIFTVSEQLSQQDPSPEFSLIKVARKCEENADWGGAESAHKQVLLIPNLELHAECIAHFNLAALYSLLHRDSDDLHHRRLASDAARAAELPVLVALALCGEALSLIRCGQISGMRCGRGGDVRDRQSPNV